MKLWVRMQRNHHENWLGAQVMYVKESQKIQLNAILQAHYLEVRALMLPLTCQPKSNRNLFQNITTSP
jgi:hypothetical protein